MLLALIIRSESGVTKQYPFHLTTNYKDNSMYRILFILSLVLAAYGIAHGQQFNYTVTTDSVAWNELNAQTILNAGNSAWNFAYKIPIGFTFNFLGRDFDSLTVETNGYVHFDGDRNYAITAFSGLGDHVDSAGNHAVLGYELSGAVGNHILKIQVLNCSPQLQGDEVLSYQIWLRENGNVEFRVGPGTLRTNSISMSTYNNVTEMDSVYFVSQVDSTQRFRIGLLNMNMDSEERGLFIGESPESPLVRSMNNANPDALYLDCIPARGYRYTFAPSN